MSSLERIIEERRIEPKKPGKFFTGGEEEITVFRTRFNSGMELVGVDMKPAKGVYSVRLQFIHVFGSPPSISCEVEEAGAGENGKPLTANLQVGFNLIGGLQVVEDGDEPPSFTDKQMEGIKEMVEEPERFALTFSNFLKGALKKAPHLKYYSPLIQ